MKVKELIDKLSELNGDLDVYFGNISGNSYEKIEKIFIDVDGDVEIE